MNTEPLPDLPAISIVSPASPTASTPSSGRAPRSDRLLHYGINFDHARVVKSRIAPLARYYWQRMGSVSIEELCMSAYIQGMMDAQQLPKYEQNT
jgi:hypothetical protein